MQVEILQFKKLLKIIYKNRTSNISNIYISIRIDIFHCNRYNFMCLWSIFDIISRVKKDGGKNNVDIKK